MKSSDMKITIIRDNRNRTPGKPGAEYIYIYSTYVYIYMIEGEREREHENTHIDTFVNMKKLTLNIWGLLALTSPDSLSFKLF